MFQNEKGEAVGKNATVGQRHPPEQLVLLDVKFLEFGIDHVSMM